jgi:Zn-dependent protease/predicted transcriptional regulator
MENAQADSGTVDRTTGFGVRLGRLGGVEVRLDWSVLVIFALVVARLGTGLLAQWHPDWGPGLRWSLAFGAGVTFFGSILLHELAHSWMAGWYGIPVARITLFLFGGVSEMQGEPNKPGQELAIAIVGPLMSFAIGVACTAGGLALAGPGFQGRLEADPVAAVAGLGPLATVLLWLGPVNVLLGAFNLVPGFPLDGGRVLRAALWQATGDLMKATRWAALVGQGVAWGLVALGLYQIFGGNFGGLWLVLIGWFLLRAARSTGFELIVRHALEGLRVGDLMRTRFEVVRADVPLARFVDEQLLRSAQTAWPVMEEDRVIGVVTLDDVAALPEERRPGLTVRDAMRSLHARLTPDEPGRDAVRAMVASPDEAVPVIEGDRIVGLLHRGDILRWLALHHEQAVGA